MDAQLSDTLIREQACVGALVAFGVLRVIGAVLACAYRWRIGVVERVFIGLAALYCAPSLADVLVHRYAAAPLAELEGNVLGCAIALFCAPIVSHRLGYE